MGSLLCGGLRQYELSLHAEKHTCVFNKGHSVLVNY